MAKLSSARTTSTNRAAVRSIGALNQIKTDIFPIHNEWLKRSGGLVEPKWNRRMPGAFSPASTSQITKRHSKSPSVIGQALRHFQTCLSNQLLLCNTNFMIALLCSTSSSTKCYWTSTFQVQENSRLKEPFIGSKWKKVVTDRQSRRLYYSCGRYRIKYGIIVLKKRI